MLLCQAKNSPHPFKVVSFPISKLWLPRPCVFCKGGCDAANTMTFPLMRSFLIGALSEMDEKAFADYVDKKAEINVERQIAFEEYGQRKNQPVISSLVRLSREIGKIVSRFADM